MTAGDYKKMAATLHLEGFKRRLDSLKNQYEENMQKFNEVCNEIDNQCITESNVQTKTVELTLISSYLDDLNEKMKNLNEIIENLKEELENS